MAEINKKARQHTREEYHQKLKYGFDTFQRGGGTFEELQTFLQFFIAEAATQCALAEQFDPIKYDETNEDIRDISEAFERSASWEAEAQQKLQVVMRRLKNKEIDLKNPRVIGGVVGNLLKDL